MPQSPDELEMQKRLDPAMRDFVQKVDKEGLQVSALIFNPDTGFLLRCGNVPAKGRELVRLHYILSAICASLEAQGYYKRSETQVGGSGPSSEELADRLVLSLLQCPSEFVPDRVLDLAMEYAQSRRPTE